MGGIPSLYVKYWWPLFFALKTQFLLPKVTFFFLNVPRRGGGGRGPPVLDISLKNWYFGNVAGGVHFSLDVLPS